MGLRALTISAVVAALSAASAFGSPVVSTVEPQSANASLCVSLTASNIAVPRATRAASSTDDAAVVYAAMASSAGIAMSVNTPFSTWCRTVASSAVSAPALPGTLLLVLAGFLCVTLVRDRVMWLSLPGRICAITHSGACALPRLALGFAPKHRPDVSETGRLILTNLSVNRRVETPEIEFVGLLRRVGPEAADAMRLFLAASGLTNPKTAVETFRTSPAAFSFSESLFPARAGREGRGS